MTDEQQFRYIANINESFTPGAPINARDLFAGRKSEVEKVIGTIFQRGQHAVLFGERGVGKTSLANILFDILVLAGRSNYRLARVNCSEQLDFGSIWSLVFRQLAAEQDGKNVSEEITQHSEMIRETFELVKEPSIVIIDEFDRISDPEIERAFADTIKTLSDNSIATTLILVGVADSLDQLIAEHQSIERAITQVEMPRMRKSELLEIVDKALVKCDVLAIDQEVKERIADYSQGLPSYTHLLAREAALMAIKSGRTDIAMDDLEHAVKEAVDTQLGTNLSAYNTATESPRGKNFRPVLLACALAAKDEHGYFYAKDVTQPLQAVTKKDYKIPAFAKHLKDFCDASRGPILERTGPPKRVKYRFLKPMMEPYVTLRGLADGLISEHQLSRPSATATEPEQLSLQFLPVAPEREL